VTVDLVNLSGKRVLVVGLARSGVAAARFCAARGAAVTVNDRREAAALTETLAALPPSVTRLLGSHPGAAFTGADLIVVSPGVPRLPELDAAEAAGVPVIPEVELAAAHLRGDLVGITGTNGKSTTTSWIGDMLAGGDRPVFVGGNLGVPLLEAVDDPAAGPGGIAVAELSSFQLERCTTLHPRVAALLNLTEDHLDRHGDLAGYGAAKARIFAAQTADDWAVVNAASPACAALVAPHRPRVARFGEGTGDAPGAWLDGDRVTVTLPGRAPLAFRAGDLALVGRHNLENAMAAAVVASLLGASPERILASLRGFRGLPHRMEAVGAVQGVRFFNDSKATNVASVAGSLGGFPGRYVLVLGGRHKGAPYTPLRAVLAGHATALLVLGEAAPLIAADLDGVAPIHAVPDVAAAVARGLALAAPGEAVILSPACSSYDQFENYEQRGAAFAAAVRQLDEERR
jgi:UDP-N-acetylmuramoylalanine--D-glutamate ligase